MAKTVELLTDHIEHHITVDAHTLLRINHVLYSKYAKEFTVFLHAERRPNGEYYLYDAFFPRQDNAATTTELESEDIMNLVADGADISKLAGHAH